MAAHMPLTDAPRVLAIVQAGGKGSRMGVLTTHRAKPALPFGGTHQLVDIAMSNLVNSGISSVWVSVQYRAGTLDKHLQHGRPWDLDRNDGGFRRIVPEEIDAVRTGGFASGNADDLYRIRHQIADENADVTVVLSADQVFTLDLRDVVAAHLAKGADLTIVTTEVPVTEASNKAVVTSDATGKVTRIDEKPEDPAHGTISAEVFVYRTAALLDALGEAEKATRPEADGEDETGLGDFAEHLIPTLVARGRVRTHALEGYWMDMGRPETYLRAHRDLVRGDVPIFDDEAWPMRTLATNKCAARVREGAVVDASYLSPGCDISGTVRRSVLGPGVIVRAGAVVEDAVVLDGTVIEKGAEVRTAIVDVDVAVRRDARVGAAPAATKARDADIAVIGAGATVRDVVKPGEQIDPGDVVG